jgi:hypothetical protein
LEKSIRYSTITTDFTNIPILDQIFSKIHLFENENRQNIPVPIPGSGEWFGSRMAGNQNRLLTPGKQKKMSKGHYHEILISD